MVGPFERLDIFGCVDFGFFDFLLSGFDGVDAGDVVAKVLEDNFLDGLVLVRSVVKGSGQSVGDDGEKIFVYFFGVFGVVFVLDVVDEELKVVEEKILVVSR